MEDKDVHRHDGRILAEVGAAVARKKRQLGR